MLDWLLPFYEVQHDRVGWGIYLPSWDLGWGEWQVVWLPLPEHQPSVQLPLFLIF